MSIKPDRWIKQMVQEKQMIAPFAPEQIKKNNISFGLSSFGYDIRLADEFKLFEARADCVIDPKNIQEDSFRYLRSKVLSIPANSYVLAKSLEYFKMPDNVLGMVVGKSTYARCGVIVNVTPLEPGWEGFLTISISNSAARPVKIYAQEGIAQILFFESEQNCAVSYRDKKGKYQGQKDITISRM
ncbi:MAG: dCTP deaminase [Candidatus Omnitrophica bacterium]|nr:dCTP deaminase [Candidatus Omnitrophota bacterium]